MSAPKSKKPFAIIGILVIGAIIFKTVVLKSDFQFAGTLEATKVDLSAQVPSTIAIVRVQEGDLVKEAQELLILSCEDIKAASKLASENYNRNEKLFKSGTVSQETMDQVKFKKEDSDVRLSWCTLKSPIQGTVLSRYHEPGEWVNPGVKLLSLANIRDLWTFIYVPEPDVSKLKLGMELVGTLPEMPGRAFKGKIIKINEEAEFTPKNVQTQAERTRLVFGVKISFLGSNEDEVLKPGMTIEFELPK